MPPSDSPDETRPDLRIGRRIPIEEFDGSARLACIDGRHDEPIVGAPGGDAGELVLLLSAFEDYAGRAFSQPVVLAILEAYMDAEGQFYLHTDRSALERLDSTLRDGASQAWEDARARGTAIEDWVANPPFGSRPLLLQYLIDPDFVGCGHLKTLLQYPEEAGVRRGLVESVIQAFLQMLWRGDSRAEYVVLEGGHAEESIVIVEDFGSDETPGVPDLEPAEGGPDIFVVHMPIRRQLWRRNLTFFADSLEMPDLDLADPDSVLEELERRAEQQLETTVRALAPTLPVWKAIVTGDSVQLTEG